MQGRRRPDGTSSMELEPGDFAKHHTTNFDQTEHWDMWFVCAPDGRVFYLANQHDRDRKGRFHEVEEHEDGMISVVPRPNNSNSIQSKHDGTGWHGWIRRGVWEHI